MRDIKYMSWILSLWRRSPLALPAVMALTAASLLMQDESVRRAFAVETSDPIAPMVTASMRADSDWDLDGTKDILVADSLHGARVYSGIDGTRLLAIPVPDDSQGFGAACTFLADVDADGVPEIVVSDSAYQQERGAVFVYRGADGSLFLRILGESEGDSFGWAIDGAGDTDSDGRGNLIIGAPGWSSSKLHQAGAVYNFGGNLKPGKFKRQTRVVGEQGGGRFGEAVASGYDFQGDGSKDLVIGAPGEREHEQDAATGAVYVLDGRKARRLHRLFGAEAGTRIGFTVRGLGDVDGDSVPDYVSGSAGSDAYALLVSGKEGRVLRLWRPEGGPVSNLIVDRAGDFDGDCHDEFVAGWWSHGDASSGAMWRVEVHSAGGPEARWGIPQALPSSDVRGIAAFSRAGHAFGGGACRLEGSSASGQLILSAFVAVRPRDD